MVDLAWRASGERPRVALLLGKPPERSPVLPDVLAVLAQSADVLVHVPRPGEPLPGWLADADAVGLRGLTREVLTRVADAEAAGVRCCNTTAATLRTRDRTAVQDALSSAGVPVPPAAPVADVEQARLWAAGRAVVVKVNDAEVGRAAGVAMWEDPARGEPPSGSGPFLVQEWVPGDGVDRKLYVAGTLVGALLKPRAGGRRGGELFVAGPTLERLARNVGAALGLRIYGVDVVEGPDGPVVVDVNAFPSCKGVPGAAAEIACVLMDHARR